MGLQFGRRGEGVEGVGSGASKEYGMQQNQLLWGQPIKPDKWKIALAICLMYINNCIIS